MKLLSTLAIPTLALGLTSCALDPQGSSQSRPQPSQPNYGQPLTASTAPGSVTIREGVRVISVCRTASPNVEETRFTNEQQQIVVKSRGHHGPATVQHFNSRTGSEEGRVMAFDIKNGQPAWAAGMGE